MFQLSKNEFEEWRSQFVTSKSDKQGLRYAPYAFTEQGVAMLSGVLNSEQAVQMNIQIMRIFTKMRDLMTTQKELLKKMNEFELKLDGKGHEIQVLFEYMKQLVEDKKARVIQSTRKQIGFKKNKM